MLKNIALLAALAAVLIAPIALRKTVQSPGSAASQELVIVSPHFEAIRSEFGRAFESAYAKRTGKSVHVDWRSPGGTSEIVRYVDSQYIASFQNYWQNTLHRPWTGVVERSFANAKLPQSLPEDSVERQARKAFLESNTGCGIDLFFGGGAFDFATEANAGRLIDAGVQQRNPELFSGLEAIPKELGGERLYDPQGRWYGVCLSAFGIVYNVDAINRLGVAEPKRWSDLGDPKLFHEVALANPTQSGSVNRAFELLIQQQLLASVTAAKQNADGGNFSKEDEKTALQAGWRNAMQLLMKIGANARYFTDSASKIALDVGAGDAAAGMSIDFYGRFESESLRAPGANSRLRFVDAEGGTSFGADTIALFRGAPHPDLARDFIDWTLSPDGQKLWDWKVGAPGGPERYPLRRLPIIPLLYQPQFDQFRADPEVNPYSPANTFVYHEQWTGSLFRSIAFIVRVMCIDPHDELSNAWGALIAAKFPPEATRTFFNADSVNYDLAGTRIRSAFGQKISEVQLAKELADGFRAQYLLAAQLAEQGR